LPEPRARMAFNGIVLIVGCGLGPAERSR
jgi:hypothetical protein